MNVKRTEQYCEFADKFFSFKKFFTLIYNKKNAAFFSDE